MILEGPELEEVQGQARITARLRRRDGERRVWFGVEPRFAEGLTTDRLDPFAVGLLPLAMAAGEELVLEGAISRRLRFHLDHEYQEILRRQVDGLVRVPLVGGEVLGPVGRAPGHHVGTGFSGGVDSLCVLRDQWLEPRPPGERITHLVFNNLGSHNLWLPPGRDPEVERRRLFQIRRARLEGFAREHGLEWVVLDSNLHEVDTRYFTSVVTNRNAAGALALQGMLSRYLVASGYPYEQIRLRWGPHPATGDTLVLPLLGTEDLDLVSDGSRWARASKLQRILDLPGVERWLDVCYIQEADGANCSRCIKCARTLLALEVLGARDRFAERFDMEVWEGVRSRYLVRLFRSPEGLFEKDVLALAASRGVRLGSWERPVGRLLAAFGPLRRLAAWTNRRLRGGTLGLEPSAATWR